MLLEIIGYTCAGLAALIAAAIVVYVLAYTFASGYHAARLFQQRDHAMRMAAMTVAASKALSEGFRGDAEVEDLINKLRAGFDAADEGGPRS